jgi:hypothetical protein
MRIQINETTAHKLRKVLGAARDPELQAIGEEIAERLERQTKVGFLSPDELEALEGYLRTTLRDAEAQAVAAGERIGLTHRLTILRDRVLPKLGELAARAARPTSGG